MNYQSTKYHVVHGLLHPNHSKRCYGASSMKLLPQPVIPACHPFLSNKYAKWYFSIIIKSKDRQIPNDIYTEIHHVIPKCLKGTNDSSNLARLTAKEHFVCHLLLTKMTTGRDQNKMIYAVWRMCCIGDKSQRHKVVGSVYQRIREEVVRLQENKVVSFETRLKIKKARALQVITDETRNNMSRAQKGKPSHRKGKKLPLQHAINAGKARRGFKYWNNGSNTRQARECPGSGWILGSLVKWTEEMHSRMKTSQQGKKWYNDSQKEICAKEHPGCGWVRGRLPKS